MFSADLSWTDGKTEKVGQRRNRKAQAHDGSTSRSSISPSACNRSIPSAHGTKSPLYLAGWGPVTPTSLTSTSSAKIDASSSSRSRSPRGPVKSSDHHVSAYFKSSSSSSYPSCSRIFADSRKQQLHKPSFNLRDPELHPDATFGVKILQTLPSGAPIDAPTTLLEDYQSVYTSYEDDYNLSPAHDLNDIAAGCWSSSARLHPAAICESYDRVKDAVYALQAKKSDSNFDPIIKKDVTISACDDDIHSVGNTSTTTSLTSGFNTTISSSNNTSVCNSASATSPLSQSQPLKQVPTNCNHHHHQFSSFPASPGSECNVAWHYSHSHSTAHINPQSATSALLTDSRYTPLATVHSHNSELGPSGPENPLPTGGTAPSNRLTNSTSMQSVCKSVEAIQASHSSQFKQHQVHHQHAISSLPCENDDTVAMYHHENTLPYESIPCRGPGTVRPYTASSCNKSTVTNCVDSSNAWKAPSEWEVEHNLAAKDHHHLYHHRSNYQHQQLHQTSRTCAPEAYPSRSGPDTSDQFTCIPNLTSSLKTDGVTQAANLENKSKVSEKIDNTIASSKGCITTSTRSTASPNLSLALVSHPPHIFYSPGAYMTPETSPGQYISLSPRTINHVDSDNSPSIVSIVSHPEHSSTANNLLTPLTSPLSPSLPPPPPPPSESGSGRLSSGEREEGIKRVTSIQIDAEDDEEVTEPERRLLLLDLLRRQRRQRRQTQRKWKLWSSSTKSSSKKTTSNANDKVKSVLAYDEGDGEKVNRGGNSGYKGKVDQDKMRTNTSDIEANGRLESLESCSTVSLDSRVSSSSDHPVEGRNKCGTGVELNGKTSMNIISKKTSSSVLRSVIRNKASKSGINTMSKAESHDLLHVSDIVVNEDKIGGRPLMVTNSIPHSLTMTSERNERPGVRSVKSVVKQSSTLGLKHRSMSLSSLSNLTLSNVACELYRYETWPWKYLDNLRVLDINVINTVQHCLTLDRRLAKLDEELTHPSCMVIQSLQSMWIKRSDNNETDSDTTLNHESGVLAQHIPDRGYYRYETLEHQIGLKHGVTHDEGFHWGKKMDSLLPLPFSTGSFDIVTSTSFWTMVQAAKIPGVLQEIYRVLRAATNFNEGSAGTVTALGMEEELDVEKFCGGRLELRVIDVYPVRGTGGPRLRSWIEERLSIGLEREFRCQRPTILVPEWMRKVGFRLTPKACRFDLTDSAVRESELNEGRENKTLKQITRKHPQDTLGLHVLRLPAVSGQRLSVSMPGKPVNLRAMLARLPTSIERRGVRAGDFGASLTEKFRERESSLSSVELLQRLLRLLITEQGEQKISQGSTGESEGYTNHTSEVTGAVVKVEDTGDQINRLAALTVQRIWEESWGRFVQMYNEDETRMLRSECDKDGSMLTISINGVPKFETTTASQLGAICETEYSVNDEVGNGKSGLTWWWKVDEIVEECREWGTCWDLVWIEGLKD